MLNPFSFVMFDDALLSLTIFLLYLLMIAIFSLLNNNGNMGPFYDIFILIYDGHCLFLDYLRHLPEDSDDRADTVGKQRLIVLHVIG